MDVRGGIINNGKTQIPLKDMGRAQLTNTLASLARDQLSTFSPKRQDLIEKLDEELKRRVTKERLKELGYIYTVDSARE
jgi:hypothetical protein